METKILFLVDQIEQNRQELERLDQQMGRRKTELQLLQDTHDRKQQELQTVLQDAETDIAARQRDIQVRIATTCLVQEGNKTKKTELKLLKNQIIWAEIIKVTKNANFFCLLLGCMSPNLLIRKLLSLMSRYHLHQIFLLIVIWCTCYWYSIFFIKLDQTYAAIFFG